MSASYWNQSGGKGSPSRLQGFVLKWRTWLKLRRLATTHLSGHVHLKYPKRGMEDDFNAVFFTDPFYLSLGVGLLDFCRLIWAESWTQWLPEIPSLQIILWPIPPFRYPRSWGSAQIKILLCLWILLKLWSFTDLSYVAVVGLVGNHWSSESEPATFEAAEHGFRFSLTKENQILKQRVQAH